MLLVTGGSGHLGANLVRRLLVEGETVRALQRPGSDNGGLDGLPIERVAGDLRDPAAVAAAVRGVDRIYHCAAKLSTVAGGEQEIFDCNVLGTRNLLRAALAAGVRRVVVTSSLGAVGHTPTRPTDEEVPFYPFRHALPYEHTKVLVELETLRAVARGLDAVIATSCAIVGPNDFKPSRLGRTLVDFANGRLRAYIPGGFEFVTTHDLCEAHLQAMAKGRTGEKYILSSGYWTVDELMSCYAEVTGVGKPRLRLPAAVMLGFASVASPILSTLAPGFPQRLTPAAVRLLSLGRRADTGKAQRELGFKPTSIQRAIEDAYAHFVQRGKIERPRRTVAFAQPSFPPRIVPASARAGGSAEA